MSEYARVCEVNSSIVPLGIGETFTGEFFNVLIYESINVFCKSDVSGTIYFDFSIDGINTAESINYDLVGGSGVFWSIPNKTMYIRVRYVNGGVGQGSFILHSVLSSDSRGNSFVPLNSGLDSTSSVGMLVKAVIADEDGVLIDADNPLHVIQPADYYSAGNSSSTPLGIGGVFTGEWVDTWASTYTQATILLLTDTSGTLSFQHSIGGIGEPDRSVDMVFTGNANAQFMSVSPRARYMRMKFTNGAVAQSSFILNTSFSSNIKGFTFLPLSYAFTDNTTVMSVKSVMSGKRDDGTYTNATFSNSNRLRVVNQPYGWAVAEGDVTDHISGTANGERQNIAVTATGDDIWLGTATTIPVPPDAGDYISVVSSSLADTMTTGANAWSVDIYYIDPADGLEKEINVQLNGTTPVNTGILMRYLNKMYIVEADGTRSAAGIIKAYKTGDVNTVYRVIPIGGNVDLGSDFMVPGDKTCYISSWNASVAGTGKPVAMRLRATLALRDGALLPRIFSSIDSAYLETSTYIGRFDFPIKLPPYTIIKITAFASQAGPYVSGGYEGWMETN